MSNKPRYAHILVIICLLLSILFLYTATSKLIHLDTFYLRLERMPFIASHASFISWAVPFLELVIGGLLWYPRYRTMALFAGFFLLGSFTFYIALVLKYSDSIPCSCGGIVSALGWSDHIIFNLVFMALSLWGIFLNSKYHKEILS